MIRLSVFFVVGLVAGCSVSVSSPSPPTSPNSPPSTTTTPSSTSIGPTTPTPKKEDDDHSHERDKMQVAHLGPKLHVWLTAHISSKTGNELDIFIETASDDKPFPLSFDKIVAKATPNGSNQTHEVVFEPAPLDERPKGEGPGQCSHYVAKCPWLKPDMMLYVTFEVQLDGKTRKSTWKNFDVKANTHHSE